MIINQVVQGGGSGSFVGIQKTIDANGVLQNASSVIDLSGVVDLGTYSLYYTYTRNNSIINADIKFPNKVTGNYACSNMFTASTSLTTFTCDSVYVINGQNSLELLCSSCSSLVSFDLSCLVVAYGYQCCKEICRDTNALQNVNLPSLKSLASYQTFYRAFYGSGITSLSFPSITTTSFGTTQTNQFAQMCRNINGITLHFPSNVQSVIEGLEGYSATAPFGATSGTVLFDLPKTVILTGVNSTEYERNPKYDTAAALAWRVKDTGTIPDLTIDWTPYYTSGTTDPSVSDAIYSDAACTQSVTTITAIA